MLLPVREMHDVIKDVPGRDLPHGAWTDGQNVRYNDGAIQKSVGYTSAYGTPTVTPYWILPVPGASTYRWVYASLNDVYTVESTPTHTQITASAGASSYAATANHNWNGGMLGEVPVLNNGVDNPQQWDPVGVGTDLADLSNWLASTTAQVIRPFNDRLIALDTTESGTRFPQRVRVSGPAAAGGVPTSWDATDASTQATVRDLLESSGFVVDCLPLGEFNVIYKEDSTFLQQFIGGTLQWAYNQRFKTSGVLATNCVQEYRGSHFALTQGDVIRHDGHTIQSIIDMRWRRWLFDNMDSDNYARSFVTINPDREELWVCFPETTQTTCTKALIYEIRENKWSVVDLPNVTHGAFGVVDTGNATAWSGQTDTWTSITRKWSSRTFNPSNVSLMLASPTNTLLYQMDQGTSANGTAFTSYVERTEIVIDDVDRQRHIKKLIPHLEADNGAVFTVRVGGQDKFGDPITWKSYTYTHGTDQDIDVRVNTRIPAVRFETSAAVSWKLRGYDLEYTNMGTR